MKKHPRSKRRWRWRKDEAEVAAQDEVQDDEGPKDGKAPGDDKAGEDAPDHADGKAVGEADAGEEARPAAKVIIQKNMRLNSRKKIQVMQKNLMRFYHELSPTLSELQSQRMEFSPDPKQISSTQVNQLIEEEVEKRIRERLLKEDARADVRKRLYQDDGQQDEEERFKVLYQEM